MIEKVLILKKELCEIIAKVYAGDATFSDAADKSEEFQKLLTQMIKDFERAKLLESCSKDSPENS